MTSSVCAAPGCDHALAGAERGPGRPALYCSVACRVRAHRARTSVPLSVEVDMGSSSSRGRLPERSWMVRLRRGEDSVIVTIGLSRNAADRLAVQIAKLLGAQTLAKDPLATRDAGPTPRRPRVT